MNVEDELQTRSESKCELCSAKKNLKVYEVPPDSNGRADQSVLICKNCLDQVTGQNEMDAKHWRCLKDSMWTQVPAVQVMSWSMITRLSAETSAQDLLEKLYLDEE
jgi:protein PhnA